MTLVVCWMGAVMAISGCRQTETQNTNLVTTSDKKPVSFLVSCDTDGWIVPCGCSAKQSGGLPRRGTLVKNLETKGPVVVLDVGGAAAGDSEYHRVKFEAVLKGELSMGIAAHNVGGSEIGLGAAVIREIAQKLSVPFVSANILDANHELIAEPMRIVERGGHRFAIIGVLEPKFGTEDVVVQDPRQAILELLDQTREAFDAIIVLAYVERAALFELAKQLPEVDMIIGGPTGQSVAPTRAGATMLTAVTNKGKFVAELNFDTSQVYPWSGKVLDVDDSLADEPIQSRNLDAYHEVLAAKDFPANLTGLSNRIQLSFDTESEFAGSDSCSKCHADDCSLFEHTKHAIAWNTLELKNSHVDPYCQQCHTTGYGLPTGFHSIAKSPNLFDVGCESCHGPSRAHVNDPKTRTVFYANDQCVSCHDQENSPAFEYNEYWSKILHGKATLTR